MPQVCSECQTIFWDFVRAVRSVRAEIESRALDQEYSGLGEDNADMRAAYFGRKPLQDAELLSEVVDKKIAHEILSGHVLRLGEFPPGR